MSAKTQTTCTLTAQGTLVGLGAPIGSGFDQTALTATGTITVSIYSFPGNAVSISKGKIRIQASAVNAATTLAIGAVTATDGTNTVQVGATTTLSTTAAGTVFDLIKEFVLGIYATSFSFTVTLAGGTQIATINTEIFGTP